VVKDLITDWSKLDVDIRVCLKSGIGTTWRFRESVSRKCLVGTSWEVAVTSFNTLSEVDGSHCAFPVLLVLVILLLRDTSFVFSDRLAARHAGVKF
jgi:hypothetical protein